MPLLPPKSRRLKSLAIAICLSAGCGDAVGSEGVDVGIDVPSVEAPLETPEATPVVEAPAEVTPIIPFEPVIEDGMARIPAGIVVAGSLPGSMNRVPRSEADAIPVELPAFRMDVEPFGGDTPQVNVTRAQAAEMCEEAGKRLCTELEWERACEGPASETFAGGENFDPTAQSAFGVRGLGAYGEWTSSTPTRDLAGTAEEGAVFRGAGGDQEPELRRCNARRGTDASTQSRHLSFRCCLGEATSATYPVERDHSRFRPLELDRAGIQALLRRVPELAEFASTFEPTNPERQLERLGEEGIAALNGWELAPAAMSWSPSRGDEVWVFHGQAQGRPFLAAVYPLPDDGLRHATSMLLEETASPIIVAFTGPERETLLWSTNWGMSAESGVLKLGEDSRLHFEIR
ncbi:MAG: formylglycine-generating enzyme family protein [Polyangiales bacterium]